MKRVITDWKKESERFDQLADIYDRYRPSYPRSMIDKIVEKAKLQPGSKLLEIGAGSGKATELFVERGYAVMCVEPGESLVQKGMKKFHDSGLVEYQLARFEESKLNQDYYDLAFSAQAFHWIPRPDGFFRIQDALKADGRMALIWNLYMKNGTVYDERLSEVCRTYSVMNLIDRAAVVQLHEDWKLEIDESGCFQDVQIFEFPWAESQTFEEFHNFLQTSSGYVGLDDDQRRNFDFESMEIFKEAGCMIQRTYCCVLYLAKKRGLDRWRK